jgi:hypothetical protein
MCRQYEFIFNAVKSALDLANLSPILFLFFTSKYSTSFGIANVVKREKSSSSGTVPMVTR